MFKSLLRYTVVFLVQCLILDPSIAKDCLLKQKPLQQVVESQALEEALGQFVHPIQSLFTAKNNRTARSIMERPKIPSKFSWPFFRKWLIAELLMRKFAIKITLERDGAHVTPYSLPDQPWTMSKIREPDERPIYSMDKVPHLTLRYRLDEMPLLSRVAKSINSDGVHIGFVKEFSFPVAIKVLHKQESPDFVEKEILLAQVLSNAGVSPLFYGLVQLEDDRFAYVMQLARGEELTEFHSFNSQIEVLNMHSLTFAGVWPGGYRVSPEGNIFVIDSGDATILDHRRFKDYLEKPRANPLSSHQARKKGYVLLTKTA